MWQLKYADKIKITKIQSKPKLFTVQRINVQNWQCDM